MPFAVVIFTDEDSVSAVPQSWLRYGSTTSCFWPPVLNATRYVANNVAPGQTWKLHTCTILKDHSK